VPDNKLAVLLVAVAAAAFIFLILSGSEFREPVQSFEGYALTARKYSETENLDLAVKLEFGLTASVADWNEIKDKFSGRGREFLDGIALTKYDEGAICYKGGSGYWSGNRHYFLARHDGKLPTTYTFLVHDTIDKHMIDLGSWYGIRKRVVVRLK